MSSQSHDLHRALLRPFIIHTLRAAGFHSTKPAVLDTLVNLAERHLLLLASTTARLALNSHEDLQPTLSDVRSALQECGILIPVEGSAAEEWTELLRRPVEDLGDAVAKGGAPRAIAEKRKREEEDLTDVREFLRWYDGSQHTEIKRIAGMGPDSTGIAGTAAVGVGGGVVQAEDFLERLKKRHHKGADDTRLQGTVLGRAAEDKGVIVEGGPVQHLKDWRPRVQDTVPVTKVASAEGVQDVVLREESMVT